MLHQSQAVKFVLAHVVMVGSFVTSPKLTHHFKFNSSSLSLVNFPSIKRSLQRGGQLPVLRLATKNPLRVTFLFEVSNRPPEIIPRRNITRSEVILALKRFHAAPLAAAAFGN
jgi:hypothetical protein